MGEITTRRPEKIRGANHYDVLGLKKNATLEQIKRAHRVLAQKWHPDKLYGDLETFRKIQLAYDTLSDPEKRKHYDEHGHDRQGPSIGERARQNLCTIFTNTVMDERLDLDSTNILEMIRQSIAKHRSEIPGRREKGEAAIKRMRKALKRLKTRKGENLIAQMIEVQIRGVRQNIEALADEDAIGVEMLRILEDYDYTHKKEPTSGWEYQTARTFFQGI